MKSELDKIVSLLVNNRFFSVPLLGAAGAYFFALAFTDKPLSTSYSVWELDPNFFSLSVFFVLLSIYVALDSSGGDEA